MTSALKTENEDRQEIVKAILHYFYQNNAKSGSHCRYSLQYHIVWIPKYRRSLLVGILAERLKEVFREIARDYRFRIIAMEVMPDHVHMLIEAPPKYAPSKIVQILKGISSRIIRQEFLQEIQKHIWKDGTLWATGYYIGSVSDKATTELVQEYIKNQKTVEKTFGENPKCFQASLFE